MEDRVNKKRGYFFVLALIFLLLLLLFFFWYITANRQKAKDWETYVMKDPSAIPAPEPHKQLIVFLKPDAQRQHFNEWIADSLVSKGEVQIRFICRNCDSSLFLFEGDGVEEYIHEKLLLMGGGGTAKGGNAPQNPRPNPAGETDELYYTTNVRVNADDAPDQETIPAIIGQPNYSEAPVKVAVFDTGLDTLTAATFKYTATVTSCIAGADEGWNFINNNNKWFDNYPGRHGTVVTRFIANEVVKYGKNNLEILPVKIFDDNGSSDLFSILCALAYASQQHVNIINASFGYYESVYEIDINGNVTTKPTSPVLLSAFVEKYLTQKNILLVAAAGNKNAAENSVYNPVDPADQRNLDSVHFYPASLAPYLPNVIAVTTAYDSLISPKQNFSNNVVDICVHADRMLQTAYETLAMVQNEVDSIRQKMNLSPGSGNGIDLNIDRAKERLDRLSDDLNFPHFSFLHPYKPGYLVEGSSFATPIVTGKLTAFFHLYNHLLDSGRVFTAQTKDSIFQILRSNASEAFLVNKAELFPKIKQGKMIYRSLNDEKEGSKQIPAQTQQLQLKPKAINGEKKK